MKIGLAFVILLFLVSTFSCGSNKNSIGEIPVAAQAKEDSSYVEGRSVKIQAPSTQTQPSSISKPDTTLTKSRKRN
jgi:hypothetical protein